MFESDITLTDRMLVIQPDIIFLDVNLGGGKDGREVCRQVKDVVPQVVIILFSANPSTLLRFDECAADDAFSKPFSFSLLEAKIDKFMLKCQ